MDGIRGPEDQAEQAVSQQQAEAARREFVALLGEFRRTAVLVPLDDQDGLWSAESGGLRWICAFSHEEALARFLRAQGATDADRDRPYLKVLGARLLDEAVGAVGVPCGVALDPGSADGVLFPPVRGIVPDPVAVDADDTEDVAA
ncbi:SseB family protein [Streptomyces sp. NPDC046716]|uniref:SseB family protein n=1 Tax=Streptomyces sp. NPDC046716 TaxID=3157093 RepID=UPI0033DBD05C